MENNNIRTFKILHFQIDGSYNRYTVMDIYSKEELHIIDIAPHEDFKVGDIIKVDFESALYNNFIHDGIKWYKIITENVEELNGEKLHDDLPGWM